MKYVCLVLPVLFLACSNGSREVSSHAPATVDTLTVMVTDTVGVLMGDSTREFGNITEVCVSSTGEIHVLDGLKCRISIFSADGSFIGTVGRYGNGPGEYLYPRSMALYSDGRILVSDWPGARITYLNGDLTVDTVLTGFGQLCPHSVDALEGYRYIGGDLEFRTGEDGLEGDLVTGVYENRIEPADILWTDPLTIVTQTVDGEQSVNVYNADVVRDTSDEGVTYLAVRSDTTWNVVGFDTCGDTLFFVEKQWEPVPKSDLELARGDYTESLSFSDDAPSSISRGRITEGISLYRTAISSIDVDTRGNIWVGQAWTDWPTFEVYSPSGEMLMVAEIPSLQGTEGLQYAMGGAVMVAYDTQPMDYPKVYLLELVD